ncbi:MAG: DUF3224 domain-containing protein [Thermomicrobiales bacterium]
MIVSTTTIECAFACTTWNEEPYSEIEGGAKLARAHVTNTLDGGIAGTSVLEYLLMYVSEAYGTFVGYERIEGKVDGREGSFCVREDGTFDATSISAELTIVEGTGTGDLAGITGVGSYKTIHGMNETAKMTFSIGFGEKDR